MNKGIGALDTILHSHICPDCGGAWKCGEAYCSTTAETVCPDHERKSFKFKHNASTFRYLTRLSTEKFWGAISMKFEAGLVTHIRREENIKPEQLSEDPRLTDAKKH